MREASPGPDQRGRGMDSGAAGQAPRARRRAVGRSWDRLAQHRLAPRADDHQVGAAGRRGQRLEHRPVQDRRPACGRDAGLRDRPQHLRLEQVVRRQVCAHRHARRPLERIAVRARRARRPRRLSPRGGPPRAVPRRGRRGRPAPVDLDDEPGVLRRGSSGAGAAAARRAALLDRRKATMEMARGTALRTGMGLGMGMARSRHRSGLSRVPSLAPRKNGSGSWRDRRCRAHEALGTKDPVGRCARRAVVVSDTCC